MKIKEILHFKSTNKKTPLYCLPKDTLDLNKPINDLYMSENHAFRSNGIWNHMKCYLKTKKIETEDIIEYYHIVVDDYFAHSINVEGVDVETCLLHDDGKSFSWNCSSDGCTPSKPFCLKDFSE